MRSLLPRIKREWVDQILIVDGGSCDGTVEFARDQGCEVVLQKSKGVRRAYVEAFPSIRGDVVITFSPDGNCIPEAIPLLVEKMKEGYDIVIASRYALGARSEDDGLLTGFGNWMFTALFNILFDGHYTDAMGIYRAWKKEVFHALDLDKEEGYASEKLVGVDGTGAEHLMSVRALKRKLRIAEIPVSEPKRVGGVKKMMPFRWGFAILVQTFRELYYWR